MEHMSFLVKNGRHKYNLAMGLIRQLEVIIADHTFQILAVILQLEAPGAIGMGTL